MPVNSTLVLIIVLHFEQQEANRIDDARWVIVEYPERGFLNLRKRTTHPTWVFF